MFSYGICDKINITDFEWEVKRGSLVVWKDTNDLCVGLMEEGNLDVYLNQNQSVFSNQDVTEELNKLYKISALSKAALARRAGMSEVYIYQVFSGRRKPSRDRLLCICIGLGVSLATTQRLLKQAAYAGLYPKHKRDAIISHGIMHQTPLEKINDKLFAENEKTLI